MNPDEFERRMRAGECFHALRVPPANWAVLRLDGRGFSRLTEARFEKPFDLRFHDLMCETSRALVGDLGALYAFTESDEISVLLARESTPFDREVEKLVSVSAAIASSIFSLGLGAPAQFDSRIWVGAPAEDVADYFRWRQSDAQYLWTALNCAIGVDRGSGWFVGGCGSDRSAVSAAESAGCAEKRETGSASEDAGGADACSSVAKAPTPAEMLATVEAAIEALEAGDVDAARAPLRGLVAALRASVTAGKTVALLRRLE